MRRVWVLLALVAGFGTAVALRRRPATGGPVSASSRTGRVAALAGASGRVGGAVVSNKAKRIFADAERREVLDRELELRTAEEVAATLGNMKGVLMKVGQMASYLDDGLAEPIRQALATLQQDAPPMSGELAASVVERELGQAPDRLFEEWDETPIAAASIGQVHRAITKDGQAVAVKVQYPGVDEAIKADLDNSDMLVNLIGMVAKGLDTEPLVKELRERLSEEVDYRIEASNQQLFADYYRGHPYIHIPDVVPELSTPRVLTTELVTGARFSELATWSEEERQLAAECIYRYVFRSLNRQRLFNGDPHPGNYLFHGGGKVTFLDYGLVKRFEEEDVQLFHRMMQAFVVDHDLEGYKSLLIEANLLKPQARMTLEEVKDYFGYFYEPIFEPREWRFTHAYAAESVNKYFGFQGEVFKYGNLPPAFIVLQRISLGLASVLAELGATNNWRAIAEELWPFTDAPPSTPMGDAELAWRKQHGR